MKRNFLSKWLGAGALAMSLAVLPSALPAAAQTTEAPGNAPVFETEAAEEDNDFDWGLLGLLGLLGLAGLKGRKNDDHNAPRYRATDDATTTTRSSRY
jgi:hypothetical protein